ncbi:SOS response-associated peptidase [Pseudonocardia sp. MCCB 268]|nr:SOS response-associated peptidase [Pseudonocardia cytotoxica]
MALTKDVTVVVERHPRDEEGNADPPPPSIAAHGALGPGASFCEGPVGGAWMVNARSETITEKPAFRRAAASRRCLFPMHGWYEWQRSKSAKQPYLHPLRRRRDDGGGRALGVLAPQGRRARREVPDGLVTGCVSPRRRSARWPRCTTGCWSSR